MSLFETIQSVTRRLGLNVHRWPSTRHIVLEFPVPAGPRYGTKAPPHAGMAQLLDAASPAMEKVLGEIERSRPLYDQIPLTTDRPMTPCWNNDWLFPLDATALIHFIASARPRLYLEIGSGNSTLFADHARKASGIDMRIWSIDPQPRREIDQLADKVIRAPLQDCDFALFDQLEPGDILFFDGSHYLLPDSDVAVFFLDILPRLKPGVLIHIHDIFWPEDYPPEWTKRYYSEQYMLALLLLHDDRYETIFASAYASVRPDWRARIAGLTGGEPLLGRYFGASYWFRARA